MTNLLLLLALFASPGFSSEEEAPSPRAVPARRREVLYRGPTPLAVYPFGDAGSAKLLLGYSPPAAELEYRAKVDQGADPTTIAGPAALYASNVGQIPGSANLFFELVDYNLSDPVSAPLKEPAGTSLVFFTMSGNKISELCRKRGAAVDTCPERLADRDIGVAMHEPNGLRFLGLAVKAEEGGGVRAASVIVRGQEIWLYYFSGKRVDSGPGLMRVRLKTDGLTRLAPPEAVKFEQAPLSSDFVSANMVRLRCPDSSFFAVSMAASTRDGTTLPFLLSDDGLKFKQAADSAIPPSEALLAAPVQLPGQATPDDCRSFYQAHSTMRTLLYSEKSATGEWELLLLPVTLPVPARAK